MNYGTTFKHEAFPVEKGTKGATRLDDMDCDVIEYCTWQTVIVCKENVLLIDTATKPTDRQMRKWKKGGVRWNYQ